MTTFSPLIANAGPALWDSVLRFNTKGGWIMSSHIAMSMMLALFPFVLFLVSLAGALSQNLDTDGLVELVFGAWPDEVAGPIVTEVQAVVDASSARLMTLGGLLAVYFSSNGVDAVRTAMTTAYRDTDERPFWQARLISLAFVVIGGGLAVAAITVGVALPFLLHQLADNLPEAWRGWADWMTSSRLQRALTWGVPVVVVAACHIWLPGHRHRLGQIWPGILLTLVLWGVAAWAFGFYLARFASYSATYAGLGGAMAALIFMYLMAVILIFGAEYNGALIKRGEEP